MCHIQEYNIRSRLIGRFIYSIWYELDADSSTDTHLIFTRCTCQRLRKDFTSSYVVPLFTWKTNSKYFWRLDVITSCSCIHTPMTLASGGIQFSRLWSTSQFLRPSDHQSTHSGGVCPQIHG